MRRSERGARGGAMPGVVTAWASCLVVLLSLGSAQPVQAQQGAEGGSAAPAADAAISAIPEEQSALYAQALARGNQAYNKEEYPAAVQSYTQAIQAAPQLPDAYRNIARAYFWQGDYDASLACYDTYLTTFPGAADRDQIQRERRLTSERSKRPWQLPEPQRAAMRALEAALSAGPAYSSGGGGAWQSYQLLLRTGYAQPGLIPLRERLFKRLLDEHDQALVTRAGQTAPTLSAQDWELQGARVEAASKAALLRAQLTEVTRRKGIHAAANAMMLSRYEDAARLALEAASANPELLFLQWFHVTALMRANRTQNALTALDALSDELRVRDPAQLEYAHVLRAMLLQRLDRADEAARIYMSALKGGE